MPSILKESDIVKFNQTVKSTIPDFESLVKKADLLNFNTGLSRNLRSAKVAAIDLTKELKVAVTTMSSGSTGALNQLQTQLKSIYGSLSSKQVSPSAAKEDLDVIAKKLELLKKIDDLESRAKLAGQGGIISSSDVTATIGKINDLRSEIASTSQLTGVLADKFNEINKAVSGKVKYDTAYDKIIASLIKQKEVLENLIKVKERYASSGSLDAAAQQIDVLKKKIESAIISKDSFRQEFSVDSKGSINKATVELQKLGVELQSDAAHTDRLKRSLNEVPMSKWIQNIGQRALAYASLYAGMYQVFNLMSKGVAYTLEYDQAIHTLSAVLDMTAASAGRLEARLAKLSVQFGGSLKDINEAALSLGRAGFDKAEVAGATENIIKMARLTGDTFATSASALITYKEVFGDVKNSTTGLTPTVDDLGDTLAYMANQSRMSTQDIGTFSNYALAAAKSSGMTAEAVSAMAISFSNAGVNASTIGTQIRRFSSVLAETSTETVNFFKQMGVSQEIMTSRMRMGTQESNKAMAEFVSKLKGMSDSEFAQITRGMDILALQSLTLLRNNADEFFKHLQKMNAGIEGEIDKSAFITESYAITWEKLGNSMGLAFNSLASAVLPMAKEVTDSLVSAMTSVTEAVTSVSNNWEAFKSKFLLAVGVMTAAFSSLLIPSIGAASVLIGNVAISLGTSIPAAMTLATAAVVRFKVAAVAAFTTTTGASAMLLGTLRMVGTALAFLFKHPVILLFTGIAAAATYAFNSIDKTMNRVSGFDTQQDIDITTEKVRNLQEELAKTTNMDKRVKLAMEIDVQQNRVDELKNKNNTENAYKDAKDAVDNAMVMAISFSKQTKELTEVAGTKAQQSFTTALDSISASLTMAIKSTKDTKDKEVIAQQIAYVESLRKKVQEADFSTEANKGKMKEWTTELDRLLTASKKLSGVFDEISGQGKLKPLNADGTKNLDYLDAYNKNYYEIKMKSIKDGASLQDPTIAANIKKMAEHMTTTEQLLGKELVATSAARSVTKNTNVGGVKDSPHTTGAGLDLAVGKGPAGYKLGLEYVNILNKNSNALNGLGTIILETNKKGSYWLHESLATAKVPKPTFLEGHLKPGGGTTTKPMNLPTLAKADGIIPEGTKTNILHPVSPESLQALQTIASDYKSMYSANVDVTNRVANTVDSITKTISKIEQFKTEFKQSQMKDLTNQKEGQKGASLFSKYSKKMEGVQDPNEFYDIIEAAKDEASKLSEKATAPELESIHGALTALEGYKGTYEDILKLVKTKAELENLGKIKMQEDVNLTAKRIQHTQEMLKLESANTIAAGQYKAAVEGTVYLNSKIMDMKSTINEQTKLESSSVERLKNLELERARTKEAIIAHNNAGIQNKAQEEVLEKRLKDVNEAISKEVDNQQNAIKAKLDLETKLLDLQRQALTATQQYSAEYDSIVNKSGTQLANIQRIADLQARINNDQNPAEATQQQTDIYNTKADDGAKSLGYKNYVVEGMGASTIQQQMGLAEGITTDYNAVYDQQLMAFKTMNERKAQIQAEFETTNGGDMMPEATRLARIQELGQLEVQLETQKNAMIATEQNKRVAHEQASFGMMLANTQTAFTGMSSIIQAATMMGLVKSKAAARAMQLISVGQAIMNTYQAASLALASTPPPFSYIAAAGAIAQGMMQVAQIKAQTFHTGGYVYDDNRAGLRSDEIPAVLQSGEYVLSRNDLKAIKDNSGTPMAPQAATKSEVVIVNSLDPSVIESYMTSRAGREVINNVVKK